MLTAEQLKAHSFRSAGKGLYRSDDVDAYMAEAGESLAQAQRKAEELQKSNDELYQRVEALANALNQLRSERELIQKTMILAQKASDDLTTQAQEESERLLREARAEAEGFSRSTREEATGLLTGAKAEVEKIVKEARAHAENIQNRARAKAEILLEEVSGKAQQERIRLAAEIEREKHELTRLQKETGRFRAELLRRLEQQKSALEQLPLFDSDDGGEEAIPAPAPAVQPAPAPAAAPVSVMMPEPEPEPMPVPDSEESAVEEEDPRVNLFGFPSTPLEELEQLEAAFEEPVRGGEGFHLV
ncbi:MAG: DivIVA domain-containing protein [Oscillospiraceae bacterium]|nr:DivIVA domain-containing protein [Oscillospiraceae bacterium]